LFICYIAKQGFSVVMLHPAEFSCSSSSCALADLDHPKLQVLKDLITYGRDRWEFRTYTDAVDAITNPVAPCSLAPTAAPVIAETEYPTVAHTSSPTSAPTAAHTSSPTVAVTRYPEPPPTACKPTVIFRLDDVEAWWCEDIAKAVIDMFLSETVPVNLGIIGAHLNQSSSLVTYLHDLASNPLIEMTTHSQTHHSFDGESVPWQQDELKCSVDMIESVTGKRPTSFIAPLNEYDSNTPIAMQAEGISVMSASCVWDPVTYDPLYCMDGSDVVAPDIMWNGVYSLPAGAVLGKEDYWTNYALPGAVVDAVGWIDAQIGKSPPPFNL
jgi:hypothetical protein